MNRREAVGRVALILGGTIIGADFFIQGCNPANPTIAELFGQDQISFLNEVAETILPATATPGAKEAGVGNFMAVMVRDCYTPENQKVFLEGISRLDNACKKEQGRTFLECDAKQRTLFLTRLDQEQKEYMKSKKAEEPNHYFRMMKELTLLGYFTSEAGCTKALRYVPVPGRFEGTIPYKKGDRAWALR